MNTSLKWLVTLVLSACLSFCQVLGYGLILWMVWPLVANTFFSSLPELYREPSLLQVTWVVILVYMLRQLVFGK